MTTRWTNDRGAATVEFAITLPMLMALLLGIFTGGFTFDQKLAVTNGVREGSRYGATLAITSSANCGSLTAATMPCWLRNVADITEQASEGNLGSGATNRSICVAYVSGGSTDIYQTTRMIRDAGGDHTPENLPCFTDNRPSTERRVQVLGSRDGEIEFFFATMTPRLSSKSVTKFEAGGS